VSTSPTLIRRARAVFQCALELDGVERMSFVRDACGGDEQLEDLVLRLLVVDEEEGEDPTAFGADFSAEMQAIARGGGKDRPRPSGYTPIRELGEGGSGMVELCRENSTGELVAVKTIDLRGLGQGGVDRVRREWRILSTLTHDAFVSLRAAGTLEERYAYLVMDFIDGLDVRSHCEVHALDARQIVSLLLPVAEALALAHSRGFRWVAR
jgi:hypothetical protein